MHLVALGWVGSWVDTSLVPAAFPLAWANFLSSFSVMILELSFCGRCSVTVGNTARDKGGSFPDFCPNIITCVRLLRKTDDQQRNWKWDVTEERWLFPGKFNINPSTALHTCDRRIYFPKTRGQGFIRTEMPIALQALRVSQQSPVSLSCFSSDVPSGRARK